MMEIILGKNKISWHYTLLYMSLILFSTTAFAQIEISGVVTDEANVTLPGVTVLEKGTKNGVTTDFDGNYTITVTKGATLVFSFIGFTTHEVTIGEQTKIDIVLKENVEKLDEVVIIGYGAQKKEQINSAVAVVDLENTKEQPKVTVDQMLQGQAAGVSVTSDSGKPGAAVSVRIRGATSLTGSNEPLYVIDGIPISGDARNTATSGRPIAGSDFTSEGETTTNPLTALNPNDIESVVVLKDASATAIYGSRGANGVVIVTTKSGKKGTGKITYDSYLTYQTQSKLLDVMNLQQYATQQNALAEIYGLEPRVEFTYPELLGAGTNWQEELFRTGVTQNHQISLSGRKDLFSYYVSGSYLKQEGTIIGSGLKRYTFKTNVDSRLKDWLRVGANLSVGVTNEDLVFGSSSNGIINYSILSAPDLAAYAGDGDFQAQEENNLGINFNNPLAMALAVDTELVRKNFFGNTYLEADIIKGLKYRFEFGGNTEFSEFDKYTPEAEYLSTEEAVYNVRRQNWYSWNLKNLVTYDKKVGKHSFTLLLGQEASESAWQGVISQGNGFVSDEIHALDVADETTSNDYKGSSSLLSFFGRLIYDFNNRYSITATYRADGSSKFSKENRWGYFPGISGSWRVSNESFMSNVKFLDDLKLRVGYGQTGNQNIGGYAYGSSLYSFTTDTGVGFLVSNLGNPDLKWESMHQTNIGLDMGFLDNKLKFTVEWYNKVSKDFLYTIPLPEYLTGNSNWEGGLSNPTVNVGEMKNTGWDISLNYGTSTNDFSWNSTLIFSTYKNELTKMNKDLNLIQTIGDINYNDITVTNSVVGQAIGQFYGLQADGLLRSDDEVTNAGTYFGETPEIGDVKYVDVSGDGIVNEDDYTYIGNPHPKFTYGFTNNFEYKGVTLSVFLQGSYGNDILNLTRKYGTRNSNLYINQLAEASDFWSVDNPDAQLPRPQLEDHNNNRISSRFVEDGSYLRIQNVTLGYNFPTNLISKIKMSRLRIYGGVQNLYTFTDYKGYDPEVGSINQNALLMGIDNGRYPSPRTYTMGLNIEF
ncbi:TonB-linked outer membrane protein, SusC/RagA family [Pustulibacterium marinum]|uniref:TonB-linked outer membrane protein, SusC/RagA family n=1 Tax=Pustulibacterium marinum TaxID=1224947 RepID=A0A1I7GFZ2_9FLAO|nr:TonB-dependent receptor [Pustulibacterium marinum]SFU47417.1 TonB-linked outer membrane protein, SusC/RagA family [Pustulibacterium marinum]